MEVRIRKDGAVKLIAKSKRDSLDLLIFLAGDDPEMADLIAKKKRECEELEQLTSII